MKRDTQRLLLDENARILGFELAELGDRSGLSRRPLACDLFAVHDCVLESVDSDK
jgi:hypothetical protein